MSELFQNALPKVNLIAEAFQLNQLFRDERSDWELVCEKTHSIIRWLNCVAELNRQGERPEAVTRQAILDVVVRAARDVINGKLEEVHNTLNKLHPDVVHAEIPF